MPRHSFDFPNAQGETLSGLLETPAEGQPIHLYALFAHCFTCGKDIAAASRISRALVARGIAVLRFDFTGLGNSDGDFSNSNYSSNVQDLLAASEALAQEASAPTLLIGHSLGGAAVLSAAAQLESVKAVVTIAAPATADHVQHLFSDASEDVRSAGQARVTIGLREFTIKRQLLEDLDQYADDDHIGHLNKALLIFHSPVDTIVPISEASRIYQAARHPKSFISLDQADHLLSKQADVDYVASTLTAWATRYLDLPEVAQSQADSDAPEVSAGEVVITEKDQKFLRGLFSHGHQWLADEPLSYGGSNLGPTPYDLLLMALGACSSMTLRMYANHKKLSLDDVDIRLRHEKIHARDCEDCEQTDGHIDRITREVTLKGDLSPEQRKRLIEIADRCPVHRTLENNPVIVTTLKP